MTSLINSPIHLVCLVAILFSTSCQSSLRTHPENEERIQKMRDNIEELGQRPPNSENNSDKEE